MINEQAPITKGTREFDLRRKRLQRLLPRHHSMIAMTLAGHDNTTIAKTLGCTSRSVEIISQSPLFQAEVARRRKESKEVETLGLDRNATLQKARMVLDGAAEKASQTLVQLLDSDDDAIRLRGADSLLDRVFGKGPGGNSAPVINISAERVVLLNIALKESDNVHVIQPANSNPTPGTEGQSGDVYQGSSKQVVSRAIPISDAFLLFI